MYTATVVDPFAGKGAADLQTDQTMNHLMGVPGGLPEKQATTESIPAMSPIRWYLSTRMT